MSVTLSARITKYPDMGKFEAANYKKHIMDIMVNTSIPEVKDMFERTVEGWDNVPDFVSEGPDDDGETIRAIIYPTGDYAEQWGLVNGGAARHTITTGSKRWFLAFPEGYLASTAPGLLGSNPKRYYGNYIYATTVSHPGFKARNFLGTMKEVYDPIFKHDMQDALKP